MPKNLKSQLDGMIFILYNEFEMSLQKKFMKTINNQLFILSTHQYIPCFNK